LQDDYVKFFRFAQWRIEKTGYGIFAMITNHSYLDNPTFRGMRRSLMNSFDDILVLNLHGNTTKRELPPNGAKDENVFDIQQGVAITLMVKTGASKAAGNVHYADSWGTRESKYETLAETDVTHTKWEKLDPTSPSYFFVPQDTKSKQEYERGWRITDVFPVYSMGITTARDEFVVSYDREELRERLSLFRAKTLSDEQIKDRFGLHDIADWKVSQARSEIRKDDVWESKISKFLYRPFDVRHLFYAEYMLARPRFDVMRHLLSSNLAFVCIRRTREESVSNFFVTQLLTDKVVISSVDNAHVFPLYLYDMTDANQTTMDLGARRPNLSPAFIAEVEARLGLKFAADDVGATLRGRPDAQTGQTQGQPHRAAPTTFGPEDIFHYIYAVFHCPTYRQRYAEFLKIDFPRLPLTRDVKLFRALAAKGAELVALHLLESPTLEKLVTRFPVAGSNEVEKPTYVAEWKDASGKTHKGCMFINKTQFFEGVAPDVWDFHIGGYQVLDKWLKDRKGRLLSYDDITHYQKIVVALKETIRLMNEIDATIPKWPIE
jgi:predicted helicase